MLRGWLGGERHTGPGAAPMRYGQPAIARAATNLQDAGVRRVLVLPLYPSTPPPPPPAWWMP